MLIGTLGWLIADLNIVTRLCVGHDRMFYKYSDAPVITTVVKDRVLGHNPIAAIYQLDSYYKKLGNDYSRTW